MKRLSRAVALTAVTLALPLAATACNKEQDKSTATETKPADQAKADTAQPSAGAPASPTAPKAAPQTEAQPGQPPQPGMPPAAPPQPGKKPDSVKDSHVKVADNIVTAANKFAGDLEAAKGDCKKATGVVKTGGVPLKKAIEETDKLQNELKGDQAAMQWFQQTYGPKMMGAIQKMGTVVQKCSTDKEFAAAFQGLGLGGPRSAPPPPPGGSGHGALPPPGQHPGGQPPAGGAPTPPPTK
jgi:hypothetical protein